MSTYHDPATATAYGPPEPLPFGVRALVVFLLADSVERVAEIVLSVIGLRELGPFANMGNGAPAFVTYMVLTGWVAVNVLLALLLLYRLQAGRIWTCVAFGLHLIYTVHYAAIATPQLWLAVGAIGRVKLLATAAIDGAAIAYLNSRSSREILSE